MKIAILDDYQDQVRTLSAFELLHGHDVKVFTSTTRGIGQLAIRLAPFDAVVLIRERTRLPAALLKKLPNLKLISQTGKLAGHVDVAAATGCGIAIAEGVGSPTAPAELAWALVLAASRRLPAYAASVRQGAWQQVASDPAANGLGRVVGGRTLGLWGYGRIGRLVAGYGRAFGMQVMVWGSQASRAAARTDGYLAAESKEEFFAAADVLSLHLRLAEATRGCVTAQDLARMKPDALFVNISRAELVEDGALLAALEAGRPGAAALDVFEEEPLPLDSAWRRLPNVLTTPHIGYVERDSYELYFRAAFENLLAWEAGRPQNIANPEVLKA